MHRLYIGRRESLQLKRSTTASSRISGRGDGGEEFRIEMRKKA
jgi:hypothetical protein